MYYHIINLNDPNVFHFQEKKTKLNISILKQQFSSTHHSKLYFIGHRQYWVSTQFILQL